jgi:hypothetical protein
MNRAFRAAANPLPGGTAKPATGDGSRIRPIKCRSVFGGLGQDLG